MSTSTYSTNTFTAAGEALFGSRWPTALGEELRLNERTVRRWILDDQAVPETVWKELLDVISERHLAIIAAQEAIEKRIEAMKPKDSSGEPTS